MDANSDETAGKASATIAKRVEVKQRVKRMFSKQPYRLADYDRLKDQHLEVVLELLRHVQGEPR